VRRVLAIRIAAPLRQVQPVLGAVHGGTHEDRRDGEHGGHGDRQPRHPGSRAGPGPGQPGEGVPYGPPPGCPVGRAVAGDRRQLPDLPGGEHGLLPQASTRPDRRRCGQPGRGLAQPAHLGLAGLAASEVLVEAGPVAVGNRVHDVGADQRVRVSAAQPCDPPGCAPAAGGRLAALCHHSTPRQSRSLIRPSRIRVLMVPTATPSSSATSR